VSQTFAAYTQSQALGFATRSRCEPIVEHAAVSMPSVSGWALRRRSTASGKQHGASGFYALAGGLMFNGLAIFSTSGLRPKLPVSGPPTERALMPKLDLSTCKRTPDLRASASGFRGTIRALAVPRLYPPREEQHSNCRSLPSNCRSLPWRQPPANSGTVEQVQSRVVDRRSRRRRRS